MFASGYLCRCCAHSHVGCRVRAGDGRQGRWTGVLKYLVTPLRRDPATLHIVSCRICLRYHHPVVRVVLVVLYSSGHLVVTECQSAHPIIDEVALVIESAQSNLVCLQVGRDTNISRERDMRVIEKHSKEHIMICREQNLAFEGTDPCMLKNRTLERVQT